MRAMGTTGFHSRWHTSGPRHRYVPFGTQPLEAPADNAGMGWMHDYLPVGADDHAVHELPGRAPGKRTLTMGMPASASSVGVVQLKAAPSSRPVAAAIHEDPFGMHLISGPVQLEATGNPADDQVHAAAARGVEGAAASLPFLDQIQASFGAKHDVSQIQAHVGGAAAEASEAMGASAYATGHHVAFMTSPDLHTAAHEAAHVVQQRGGVQLKGGVGQVGDEYERHADAVADKVVRGESAEELLDQGAGTGAVGEAVQRRAAPPAGGASAGPELRVPRLIEFDDVEIGERQRRETILWNTGPSEARVIGAEVAIDKNQRQFQVRTVPDRIMPTSSVAAAKSGEIAIDFVPQGEGLRTDSLRLTVKSIDAHGVQRVFEIVLAGRGHLSGHPTHAQAEARERQEEERDAKATADREHEAARDERTRRNTEDSRVAPTGRLAVFDARLDGIRDDIRAIDTKRAEGITIVEKEASSFRRRLPPPTPSTWDYVREGAALALAIASYGLAQGLAAALVGGGTQARGAVGIGVGVGDDGQPEQKQPDRRGIRKSVEKALGKGAEWVIGQTVKPTSRAPGDEPTPSGSEGSGDPSVAFFASQRMALTDTSLKRLGEITYLGPELVDQLHGDGEFRAVLATLDAVRAELGQVAGTSAATEQSKATAAQWISFVSKRSGETHKVGAGEGALAAGTPHAELVSDLRPLDTRDGVIEIHFAADLKEPSAPVRIVGVRVQGVAKTVAERIRYMNPAEVPLPLRAVARGLTFGGQSIAEPALVVARNEAGEITVAAGKPGELPDTNQQARYLAAKHAPERQNQRRAGDVEAGGRRLVEEDIFGQWNSVIGAVDDSNVPAMQMESDDASKAKL